MSELPELDYDARQRLQGRCPAGCSHGWTYSPHDGSRSLCTECDDADEYYDAPEFIGDDGYTMVDLGGGMVVPLRELMEDDE